MGPIFTAWPEHASSDFGQRPLVLRHGLAQSSLFSDENLEKLIEATPRSSYHVNTMPLDAHDPRLWREGDMTGLSGREVMDAVRRGELWVHLRQVQEARREYRELLDAAFAELSRRVTGLRTFQRSMSVLISSPKMNVAYHADVPGQSLWQVRGRKRVWIYPARPPFLPARAIENIVLKRASDTDLTFDPAFDQHAQSFLLQPGDMATWPRNCPHRVVNEDCVNVSFTTEHWTPDLRAGYAVDYANGLLRPWMGERDLSRRTRGIAFSAKFVLAGAHKMVRRLKPRVELPKAMFRVAPGERRGYREIAAGSRSK